MTEFEKKAEEINNRLFSDLYVPALVDAYNKKAEEVGLSKIASEEDLQNALGIVKFIEDNGASSVNEDNQDNDLSKAASVFNQEQNVDILEKVAVAGATDQDLVNKIKELVSMSEK